MSTPPAPPRPAGQRIAKLLARAGIASRREVERMIADGRVALNGLALTTPARVLPSLAGVTVDGKPVRAAEPARLFRFHKPAGLLTTERDPKGRRTIYDALPKDLPRVMPVGRLDLNTEGLLLLTTDGELKRHLELPATGVERTYRARAFGEVSQEQLEELIHGVTIDGVRYGAIDANLERRTGRNQWIEMRLAEGKNREVRRVLEHLGLQVSRLIRTAYGPFGVEDLPPGAVAEVQPRHLDHFVKGLKMPRSAMPVVARTPRPAPAQAEPKDATPRPRRAASEADGRARTGAAAKSRPSPTNAAGPKPGDLADKPRRQRAATEARAQSSEQGAQPRRSSGAKGAAEARPARANGGAKPGRPSDPKRPPRTPGKRGPARPRKPERPG